MDAPDDNARMLELYRPLRVADVRDGMDWLMMHGEGSMSPEIRPLWRTRAVGIARTARYVPFEGPVPDMTPQEYSEWSSRYYAEVCIYPWMAKIQAGDFIVIDQSGVDAGLMGSNNSLGGVRNGAVGYVTNGGVRDTDELILQRVRFWSRLVSQSMVQARLKFDAEGAAVEVGGVTVHPGDVVAADGDGVIVVPRDRAAEVATHARRELDADKTSRRKLYEQLGMELDDSVT